MTTTRDLTGGQIAVLGTAGVIMTAVGGIGAWGTYTNTMSEFHRQATAAGVVAAGEGLTLVLGLLMLGRTMMGQSSPAVVRGGMWLAPLSAACIGVTIADTAQTAAVYAVTPLAMSGAAEALSYIARSIVVYRTGRDADADRRNADVVQQLAYQQALAAGHPDDDVQNAATRKAWKLIGRVGVGDQQLAEGLVEVSRARLTTGAGHALDQMLALPGAEAPKSPPPPRPFSATERLRAHMAGMDPTDAIHFASAARPDAPPAELSTILGTYGITVDPVAVALVLAQRDPEYTVDRPDAGVAPQVSALPALNVQGAVEEAAAFLGSSASAREIAVYLERTRRLIVPENHIRSALSRAAKKTEPPMAATPGDDLMRGGYN
ncbi:hypothetical protein ACSCBZ_42530 [Streptomyces niveiscabiei]|uniref:hypothetical protein n=1 Tax=Streptomyces niveiscabiei TaxID=164115 RepID=UPI0006EBCAA9|nr:hypothetical protein [Streptomyces niveiscabiei]